MSWMIETTMLTVSPVFFTQWMDHVPQLLLATALGQVLSICYELSYEGLSFSRRFVNSLTLLTLTSCVLMLAISVHIALGLGLLGSMSMIRFRVNARDLWEMSFLFSALVTGLCCGINLFWIAISFTTLFSLVAYYLSKGHIGTQFRFDGVLRFWLPYHFINHDSVESTPPDAKHNHALEDVLKKYASNYQLISMREGSQGEGAEVSYHITLKGRRHTDRKAANRQALFKDLKLILGCEELTLLSQDHHLEL